MCHCIYIHYVPGVIQLVNEERTPPRSHIASGIGRTRNRVTPEASSSPPRSDLEPQGWSPLAGRGGFGLSAREVKSQGRDWDQQPSEKQLAANSGPGRT